MSKRILTITWKPDVSTLFNHKGSFKKGDKYYNYEKGKTSRSERESFWNVKTKEKAEAIVNRRNKNEILLAKYGESIIFSATEFEKTTSKQTKKSNFNSTKS